MVRCSLCQLTFPSRLQLVEHLMGVHSNGRGRSKREKLPANKVMPSAGGPAVVTMDKEKKASSTQASLRKHQCDTKDSKLKKELVICQHCGECYKDYRRAAIHQLFCIKKHQAPKEVNVTSLPGCSMKDSGALFKTEDQLSRHFRRRHSNRHDVSQPSPKDRRSVQPPPVTVTMNPHVGKTEGLQDLSLLVNPTKGTEKSVEYPFFSEGDFSSRKEKKNKEVAAHTNMDERRFLDDVSGINYESILYIAEDGTVLQGAGGEGGIPLDVAGEETANMVITEDEGTEGMQQNCTLCQQSFITEDLLASHMISEHSCTVVKEEPKDSDYDSTHDYNDNEDYEPQTMKKRVKMVESNVDRKKQYEYKCSTCKSNFLYESSYLSHVENKECKERKLKLPRMFSCHFKQCDSIYFKLSQLQKHWKDVHKYSLPSRTLEFRDEKTFTDWLAHEEEKHKVRFTCDVRRRKPNWSERLLVCHRFHNLRTSAARKNANREYSEKHNWVHKIQPCLCFARLKVYQKFEKETCGYTGRVSVVYYPQHNHPKINLVKEECEALEHVLQRNKRNRKKRFRDLKGTEKHIHRQKLEKLAQLARKDDFPKMPELKLKLKDAPITGKGNHSMLSTEDIFESEGELVLDGQFDMGPEDLSEHVVTLHGFPVECEGQGSKVAEDMKLHRNNNHR